MAVIEEIQTDWIRDIKSDLKWEKDYVKELEDPAVESLEDLKTYKKYCDHVLPRFEHIWSEAMLMATLHVLKTQLSIRRVYFHSAESGLKFKWLGRCEPPRSLYTSLPKKMGFQKTSFLPGWIANRFSGNRPPLKRKGRRSRYGTKMLWRELALLEAFREGEMHWWVWDFQQS